MGSEHGLDCMLEVVACRALDAQSLARSSCTKEGAAAFANSEKAMWPVAEVSCSRLGLLACGCAGARGELNLQTKVRLARRSKDRSLELIRELIEACNA